MREQSLKENCSSSRNHQISIAPQLGMGVHRYLPTPWSNVDWSALMPVLHRQPKLLYYKCSHIQKIWLCSHIQKIWFHICPSRYPTLTVFHVPFYNSSLGRNCGIDVLLWTKNPQRVLLRPAVSFYVDWHPLHIEISLRSLKAALASGYGGKNLEGGFTLCPFSKIIVVG